MTRNGFLLVLCATIGLILSACSNDAPRAPIGPPILDSVQQALAPTVAPNLIGPSGVITTTTPTYQWNPIPGGVYGYYLWVDNSSGAAVVQQLVTESAAGCPGGVGICSFVSPTLAVDRHTFYVRGQDAGGSAGPWSSGMSFANNTALTIAPTLIGPSGVITTTTPTYQWNPIPGGVYGYYVWVNNSSGAAVVQQIITESEAGCPGGVGICSFVSPMLAAGRHTFYVRDQDAGGSAGPWSSGMSFADTTALTIAPTLIGPSGVITTTTPTYQWNPIPGGVYGYYVWVDDMLSGAAVVQQVVTESEAGCPGGVGTCSFVSPTLAAGRHTFYVRGQDANGNGGPWSSGMSFASNTALTIAPTLIGPSGVITTTTPTYEWNPIPGGVYGYYVWVDDMLSGAAVVQQVVTESDAGCALGVGICSFVSPTLAAGQHTFYVRGQDANGNGGPWSSGMGFTVPVKSAISGTVSGAIVTGVTVTLTGPTSATFTTDTTGTYTFSNLDNGTYTVVPSHSGYTFLPTKRTVTINNASVTGQNFTANTIICSSANWCWDNPLPQGNDFHGVWGSAANNVWAVGDNGTIVHWTGSFWSTVASTTTNVLYGVWGSAANDVWAVGEGGMVLHWTGSVWASVASGTTSGLVSVWGSGSGDVWAVGYDGTIVHCGGSTCVSVANTGTLDSLLGVWGSASNDVWAVGEMGTIVHWDGSAWSWYDSNTTNSLSSVWGSGANDVLAVGSLGTVVQWNGTAWNSVGSTTNDLYGVWGIGAADIWASEDIGGSGGAVLHGTGASWSSMSSGTTSVLLSFWGSATNDVWAVGKDGAIVHWDGAVWSDMTGLPKNVLSAVWGSGPTDIWAVGWNGTIIHRDATDWSTVASNTTNDLSGIWGSGASDVWVVGSLGTILHWNGTNWSGVASGATDSLVAVWGSASNNVWAVGDEGTIIHWTGTSWSSVASGTSQTLLGVWGSGASDVWAVGYLGTALHWNGSVWSSVASGTANTLSSVWGSGPSDVWAVGVSDEAGGTLIQYTGVDWSNAVGATSDSLAGLWGSATNDIYAVGNFGSIQHWNGSAWVLEASGTTNFLNGVWGSSANDVWAVGWDGTVLRHQQ